MPVTPCRADAVHAFSRTSAVRKIAGTNRHGRNRERELQVSEPPQKSQAEDAALITILPVKEADQSDAGADIQVRP